MDSLVTRLQGQIAHFRTQPPLRDRHDRLWLDRLRAVGCSVGMGLAIALGTGLSPAAAVTVAPELQSILSDIDRAASAKDPSLLQRFAPDFRSADGLSRDELGRSLAQFWQNFDRVSYQTTVDKLDRDRDGWTIETLTEITATKDSTSLGPAKLTAQVRARQIIRNGVIVRQELLSERTTTQWGSKPPSVRVRLPERVRPGETYSFDAIVQDPLGDTLLAGGAIDAPVRPESYTVPQDAALEPISAGGLFKLGRAPSSPGSRWISAVLVGPEGMTWVTQRLDVR
jgi:hypothetical protein